MARTRAQSRAEARSDSVAAREEAHSPASSKGQIQPKNGKRKRSEHEKPDEEKVKRKTSAQKGESVRTSEVARNGRAKGKAEGRDEDVPTYKSQSNHSETTAKIENLIAKYGDLPIPNTNLPTPKKPTSETILAHILNALLSSARISHTIAKRALQVLMEHGYHNFKILSASTWKERVAVLDEGGYARYDFSTATKLGKLATLLKNKYDSDATKILPSESDSALNRKILQDRLKEISGLGPLGIELFISTMQMAWPSLCPFIVSRDIQVADQIGLGKDVDAIYMQLGKDPERMARLSVALGKIRLEKRIGEFS
ncbi:hypothetical protein F5884DRAFT_863211 [Xylogone sp. PMI_703]|nr:hypothetical protein F5884DRAFT_863211 [Xylogone sp. PMI_703]